MRIPLCLAILFCLSSAAPAAAQTARAACQPPPPDRAEDVAHEARLAPIVDTIARELKEAGRTAGIGQPAGLVIVEVRNRRTGEARTSSHGSNLPDSLLARVVARRAALLARLPERATVLHVRLDPLPADENVPAVECMPVLLDPGAFGREMTRIVRQLPAGGSGGPTRLALNIRMLVTRDGEVAYAALSRRSSRSDVDREVLQFARRLRFQPARVRAVPVDVWVEQPLQVELPAQRPGP